MPTFEVRFAPITKEKLDAKETVEAERFLVDHLGNLLLVNFDCFSKEKIPVASVAAGQWICVVTLLKEKKHYEHPSPEELRDEI